MGCVVFQEQAPSPPLESISLLGDCIEARDLGILKPYKTGKIHPLASLAKKIMPGLPVHRVPDVRSIMIPRGVEDGFHSTIGGKTETLTTPEPIPASVIYHDTETSAVLLLVPGLGICSVDACLLPLKRRRVEVNAPAQLVFTSRLRNFVLFQKRGRVQDANGLEQFFDLMGDSLHGLGLCISTLTAADLRAIMAKCPNLESFTVGWASLPSLDFVFGANSNGCKISSLEFMGGQVDDQDQNIRKLLDELRDRNSAIAKTLRRLYITWPIEHWEIIDAPDELLNENKDLTHFFYSSPTGRTHWTIERHHGELLRDAPLILDDETRLSLNRVLRDVARTYPTVQPNEIVEDLIRHFASTMQRRMTIGDPNAGAETVGS